MASKEDLITIKQCPLCKNSHTYELNIERCMVMYRVAPGMDTSPRKKSFTRLFSCPKTSKDFQASFVVTEYFGSRIESVEVAGVTTDEIQDK